jgi:hypothetical protein
MARQVRIQFEDAVHHVMTRGDRRENISDATRIGGLRLLVKLAKRPDGLLMCGFLMSKDR